MYYLRALQYFIIILPVCSGPFLRAKSLHVSCAQVLTRVFLLHTKQFGHQNDKEHKGTGNSSWIIKEQKKRMVWVPVSEAHVGCWAASLVPGRTSVPPYVHFSFNTPPEEETHVFPVNDVRPSFRHRGRKLACRVPHDDLCPASVHGPRVWARFAPGQAYKKLSIKSAEIEGRADRTKTMLLRRMGRSRDRIGNQIPSEQSFGLYGYIAGWSILLWVIWLSYSSLL